MFGMLVVYCYKNIEILTGYHGIPDLLAGIVVLGLHFWKKNMFLSIAVGTLFYMALVQLILYKFPLQTVASFSYLFLTLKIFYHTHRFYF